MREHSKRKIVKQVHSVRGECIAGCGRVTIKIRGGECRWCRRARLVKGGRIIQKLRQAASVKRRHIVKGKRS